MARDFRLFMSKQPDKELAKIVTLKRDSFNPDAVKAAEEELKKRNIDIKNFDEWELLEETAKDKANFHLSGDKRMIMIRLADVIIDFVAIYIVIILVSRIAIWISPYFYYYNGGIFFILNILIYLAYYYFMEERFGKTLGKFITKTKVKNSEGDTMPERKQIIIRSLVRLIPLEGIMIFFSENTTLHDYLSKTFVEKVE